MTDPSPSVLCAMGASFTETNGKAPFYQTPAFPQKQVKTIWLHAMSCMGQSTKYERRMQYHAHYHVAHAHIGCGLTGKLGTGEMAHN
ncbi:hypothetical protein D3C78_830400 [compost metagenome]